MSARRKSGGLAAETLRAIVGGAEATADIVAAVGADVSAPLRALRANGLIIQIANGRHVATDKGRELVASGAAAIKSPPKTRGRRGASFRAVIWRAIRVLRTFSLDELLRSIGVAEDEWARRRRTAANWIKKLIDQGYLTPARKAGGLARYRLAIDPGPTPPVGPAVEARP